MSEERLTGTVKWFDQNKGYGFITSGSTDYFFHIKNCESYNLPQQGDIVTFTENKTEKGLSGIAVKKQIVDIQEM